MVQLFRAGRVHDGIVAHLGTLDASTMGKARETVPHMAHIRTKHLSKTCYQGKQALRTDAWAVVLASRTFLQSELC